MEEPAYSLSTDKFLCIVDAIEGLHPMTLEQVNEWITEGIHGLSIFIEPGIVSIGSDKGMLSQKMTQEQIFSLIDILTQ
jgi:hypothetical protein